MKKLNNLNETQWAPNIGLTDENLSLNGVYQELKLPSLARSIFTVSDMHGPTAAIFNITGNDHGGISLVRSEVEIYDNEPVRTKITQETLQDIETQFGEDGKRSVAVLLRGFANDNENEKTIEFLKTHAVQSSSLTISEPSSPDFTWREISWKVQQCVLEMNKKRIRTYHAFVVLPYKYASAIMSVFADLRNSELANESTLFVGQSGLTKWFINPDQNDNNVYVGLKDEVDAGRGCAVFSPYQNEITDAVDWKTGERVYFIWNRFAITISPLHTNENPLLMRFEVV